MERTPAAALLLLTASPAASARASASCSAYSSGTHSPPSAPEPSEGSVPPEACSRLASDCRRRGPLSTVWGHGSLYPWIRFKDFDSHSAGTAWWAVVGSSWYVTDDHNIFTKKMYRSVVLRAHPRAQGRLLHEFHLVSVVPFYTGARHCTRQLIGDGQFQRQTCTAEPRCKACLSHPKPGSESHEAATGVIQYSDR